MHYHYSIVPGTITSYLCSMHTIRSLKIFNLNSISNNNSNMDDIIIKEYTDFYYTYISMNLLLSLTCNCLPYTLSWLNQALPKNLIERFILFETHPLESLSIKYFLVSNFLVKVLTHIRNRRKGKFNIKEFKKLFEESKSLINTIQQDYFFIQNNEYKSKLKYQEYFYLMFYVSKLILFNIELSPYVYEEKLLPSKKYIKIKSINTKNESHLENEKNYSNNNDGGSSSINSKNDKSSYLYDDFKRGYKNLSLLEKIKYPGFNYKLDDDSKITQNEGGGDNNNDENTKFLIIPTPISNINYKNCYRVCYETAEKATLFLKELNKELNQNRMYYSFYSCFVFYHIGLFYMMVYANFKEERVKDIIEFYHEQIKVMDSYFPYLTYYYSKTYEKAKKEAYIAYSDNSIIFCPR